jgi:hypothetical protein
MNGNGCNLQQAAPINGLKGLSEVGCLTNFNGAVTTGTPL